MMPGAVALVGAGPGDPELLTIRGLRLLQQADVVIHDRLGTEQLLQYVRPDCELVDAGKVPGRHGMTQEQISDALIHHARRGKRVVRLKGGDPFVFGRGGEEMMALVEAGIPFDVVPGVSSAVAVPAAAGIPVTHRGLARTVTIASGHDDPDSPAARERWRALAPVPGTLVLLMAMSNLDAITQALVEGGRAADEPAAAIQWGTTDREHQVTATLGTIAAACAREGLGNPAVVVIGAVVALGEMMSSAMGAAVDDLSGDDRHHDLQVGVEHHDVPARANLQAPQVSPSE